MLKPQSLSLSQTNASWMQRLLLLHSNCHSSPTQTQNKCSRTAISQLLSHTTKCSRTAISQLLELKIIFSNYHFTLTKHKLNVLELSFIAYSNQKYILSTYINWLQAYQSHIDYYTLLSTLSLKVLQLTPFCVILRKTNVMTT